MARVWARPTQRHKIAEERILAEVPLIIERNLRPHLRVEDFIKWLRSQRGAFGRRFLLAYDSLHDLTAKRAEAWLRSKPEKPELHNEARFFELKERGEEGYSIEWSSFERHVLPEINKR